VDQARQGDDAVRERLIYDHRLFIEKIVAKRVSGPGEISSRDEYSVGLMAFNEAIDCFRPGFRSFQSFAASVIEKRLIDYFRSQQKHRSVYTLDETSEYPDPQGAQISEKIQVKLEMEQFIRRLSLFNISLRDLVEETPKHIDSRQLCLRIARTITRDPVLCGHFKKYSTIPVKKVMEIMKINEKTIQRHRSYIIGICLVLSSDLETMKGYVESMSRGGDGDAG